MTGKVTVLTIPPRWPHFGFVAFGIAAVCCFAAIVPGIRVLFPALIGAALAAVAIGFEVWGRRLARRLLTMETVTRNGQIVALRFCEAGDESELRVADVTGVVYCRRWEEPNGERVAYRQEAWLWREGVAPTRCRYRVPIPGSDPLRPFWDAVVATLAARAAADLAQGRTIASSGWTLTNDELRSNGRSMKLAKLATFDFDDELQVWEVGQALPSLTVRGCERNRLLLHELLYRRLRDQPPPPIAVPGLGRMLFERRRPAWECWALIAFAAALLLVIVGLAFVTPRARGRGAWKGALAVGAIAATPVLLLAFGYSRRRFRVHERGVWARGPFREAALAFDEIDSLQWAAVRMYFKGGYYGTMIRMVCKPAPGSRRRAVVYRDQVPSLDPKILDVRSRIQKMLAERGGTKPQ